MAQPETTKTEQTTGTRAASVLETAALCFTLLFALLLCSAAFASTSVIDPEHYKSGSILFQPDSLLYNGVVLVVLAAIARAIRLLRVSDRTIRALTALALVLMGLVGLVWIFLSKAAPGGEQESVLAAAKALVAGKTKNLAGTKYDLHFYFAVSPNRFGELLYAEGLLRVFGEKGYLLAAPALNVAFLLVAYASLLKTTGRLFRDNRVTFLTLLLLCAFLPPLLACTAMDASTLAFLLCVLAFSQTVRFIQFGRRREAVYAALLCLPAAALNPAALVAAAAIALTLGLHALKSGKWTGAAAALLALVLALAGPLSMRTLYEKRLDADFGAGFGAAVWKAAYQVSGPAASRAGALDYLDALRDDYKLDFSAYDERAKEDLAERTEGQTALEKARSLAERFGADWNEPTFGSVWVGGAYKPFGERTDFINSFYGEGRAAKNLGGMLNHTVQLVYAGFLLAALLLLRRRTTEQMLLPLAALGGAFAFSFTGVSSAEALRFVPLLLPLAAYGALAFGLDLSTRLTRPETAWEETKSRRGRRDVH